MTKTFTLTKFSLEKRERESDERELRWNSILQYANFISGLFHGVIIVPFFLKHVQREEFGIWIITSSIVAWAAIIDPGISILAQQRVAAAFGQGKKHDAAAVSRQAIKITLILAILVGCLISLLSSKIQSIIDPKQTLSYRTCWWLVALSGWSVAVMLVANCLTGLGVAARCARVHTVSLIVSVFVGFTISIALISNGTGVLSIPIGMIFRSGIQATLSGFHLYTSLPSTSSPESKHFKLKISDLRWSLLEKISATIATTADTIVLGRVSDPGSITSYTLTKRPVDLLIGFLQRPIQSITPTLSYRSGRGDSKAQIALINQNSTKVLFLGGLLAVLVGTGLERAVSLWVGAQNFAGKNMALALSSFLLSSVLSSLFGNIVWALGEAKKYNVISMLSSLVSVIGIIASAALIGPAAIIATLAIIRLGTAFLFIKISTQKLQIDPEYKRTLALQIIATGIPAVISLGLIVLYEALTGNQINDWLKAASASTCYLSIALILHKLLIINPPGSLAYKKTT
jgi:O-antigen/teichoic acid export membrane protein